MSMMQLHRICWECYHFYFEGRAAVARCVDEANGIELPSPKKCHFCGEETRSALEMARHPTSVLARDCADIHAEESAPEPPAETPIEITREIPVFAEDSPYPATGDIAFDEAGRIMQWTPDGGWEYSEAPCGHERQLKEFKEQLDFANKFVVELAADLAIERRNRIRPHAVLADIFDGVVVMAEHAKELGMVTLVYTLPTGSVAVSVRLADIDLLEGLSRVESFDAALPTETDSFEAMLGMASCPRRVVYGSEEELHGIAEAFNNYELAGGGA